MDTACHPPAAQRVGQASPYLRSHNQQQWYSACKWRCPFGVGEEIRPSHSWHHQLLLLLRLRQELVVQIRVTRAAGSSITPPMVCPSTSTLFLDLNSARSHSLLSSFPVTCNTGSGTRTCTTSELVHIVLIHHFAARENKWEVRYVTRITHPSRAVLNGTVHPPANTWEVHTRTHHCDVSSILVLKSNTNIQTVCT